MNLVIISTIIFSYMGKNNEAVYLKESPNWKFWRRNSYEYVLKTYIWTGSATRLVVNEFPWGQGGLERTQDSLKHNISPNQIP